MLTFINQCHAFLEKSNHLPNNKYQSRLSIKHPTRRDFREKNNWGQERRLIR